MDAILKVRNLSVAFRTFEGRVRALDRVSFDVFPGETLGIVGESGCGKSVTSLCILRLIPSPPGEITGGAIDFRGTDILRLSPAEMRSVRGQKISMIFQEPMTSLSPVFTVVSRSRKYTGSTRSSEDARPWRAALRCSTR